MMLWFGAAFVTVGIASLAFTLVTYLCVGKVRSRIADAASSSRPAISILKPLKGAPSELYENLVSFALQDYPRFEIIFGCKDITDPALAVARRVQREFPHVPITVVAGGPGIGLNPKVNNLKQLAEMSRFDYWLISDADVRVNRDYLQALAAEIQWPDVGLVTNVISGVGEEGLGAALENLHLNTFIAASVCGADILAGHPCVIGKSMLFRRMDFENLDGWNTVKDVLAEDYVLGRLFRSAGYDVALCPYVIQTVVPRRDVFDFLRRHLRWGQMRRRIAPTLYWCEPLLLPWVWLSAGLLLLVLDGDVTSGAKTAFVGLGGVGLWIKLLSDYKLVTSLRGAPATIGHICLAGLKDWMMVCVWAVAAVRTTIEWRGNLLRIGPDSRLTPLHGRSSVVTSLGYGENRSA